MHSTVFTGLCLQDVQEYVPRACPVLEREASMGNKYDFETKEAVAVNKYTWEEQSSPKAQRHILLVTKNSGRPFIQWE